MIKPPNYRKEVKPLSKEEKDWMIKLEQTLMSCPKRLGLYTIGDAGLSIVDFSIMEKYSLELHDGLAITHGIHLGDIRSAVTIDGVSG